MIEIKITSDKKTISVSSEAHIEGTRRDAIHEFACAMKALKKIDKEVFRDALQVLVKEDILDMMDEMDEDEDGKHDD